MCDVVSGVDLEVIRSTLATANLMEMGWGGVIEDTEAALALTYGGGAGLVAATTVLLSRAGKAQEIDANLVIEVLEDFGLRVTTEVDGVPICFVHRPPHEGVCVWTSAVVSPNTPKELLWVDVEESWVCQQFAPWEEGQAVRWVYLDVAARLASALTGHPYTWRDVAEMLGLDESSLEADMHATEVGRLVARFNRVSDMEDDQRREEGWPEDMCGLDYVYDGGPQSAWIDFVPSWDETGGCMGAERPTTVVEFVGAAIRYGRPHKDGVSKLRQLPTWELVYAFEMASLHIDGLWVWFERRNFSDTVYIEREKVACLIAGLRHLLGDRVIPLEDMLETFDARMGRLARKHSTAPVNLMRDPAAAGLRGWWIPDVRDAVQVPASV